MKYKVGDKVWILDSLCLGSCYNDIFYKVNGYEVDIRGKLVEIISHDSDSYCCEGYRNFNDAMIDHSKTGYETKTSYTHSSQIPNQEPQYEIY